MSIGGNIGDVPSSFNEALRLLDEAGFRVERASSAYRNPAVGCEDGAPDFFNWAVKGHWDGTPEALLAVTQSIEVALGRPKDHPHWHSRTLDIDIIFCNGEERSTPELTLPHPRWRERSFVLIPLREISDGEI
ncbi:MAG: 2-amino-4-hydroxy-6-hydroxymethyldihydropteridine diphosphokinase [Lentisphaeria bacterium]|nr:2-amino-4-hydroxy-6-hydroxymethyldihydropteridine diphosphokinase [Lentisphaeria bacterium]